MCFCVFVTADRQHVASRQERSKTQKRKRNKYQIPKISIADLIYTSHPFVRPAVSLPGLAVDGRQLVNLYFGVLDDLVVLAVECCGA